MKIQNELEIALAKNMLHHKETVMIYLTESSQLCCN